MSVKSIKKQLAAAIAMVLVAAVALGSSTYAWFASNNSVTANGLTVNAQAEGSMLIIADSQANLINKATTVNLNNDGGSLYPVHPIYTDGGEITQWNHAYSDSFTTAISNSTEVNITTITDKGSSDFYLTDEIWIGLDDANSAATAQNLRVKSCTLTSADNSLLPSARVLLVHEGKVVGVYGNGTVVTTQGSATAADQTATLTSDGASYNSPIIKDSLSAGAAEKLEAFVYFDGRDTYCTSEKYKDIDVTVEIQFMVD